MVKSPEWQCNMTIRPSAWSSAGLLQFFYLYSIVLILERGGYYYYYYYQCGGPASRWIYPPNWGPEEPSGVQLRLCVCLSVFLSLCLSLSLSLSLSFCRVFWVTFWRTFARPEIACSACGRRPWVQIPRVTVLYVRPSVHSYVPSSAGLLQFLYLYSIV